MILLDTNAALFLLFGNPRVRLLQQERALYFSPLSLLEMQVLMECKRVQFEVEDPVAAARADPRWAVDDVSIDVLVRHAMPLGFTRDPFDRLLAAHAIGRGWKLATSDQRLIEQLPRRHVLAI